MLRHGSGVASQFVGNDLQWFRTLAAQEFSKKSLCGGLITMRLDQNVDHVAVLIHGAPQIPLLAVDSNEDFIQNASGRPAVPLVKGLGADHVFDYGKAGWSADVFSDS